MDTYPIYGASLCSGAGMLDEAIGLVLPGHRCLVYVEREIAAVEVLEARMAEGSIPDALVWDDLKTFDGGRFRRDDGRGVSVLTAGLPCQPYSVAGKQLGDKDERYIWDEFFRIVAQMRPAVVLLENVPGFVRWFRPVGEELADMGYEFEAGIYSAEEVGAAHRRERFFCLAYAPRDERAGRIIREAGRWRGVRETGGELADRDRAGSEARHVVTISGEAQRPMPVGLQSELEHAEHVGRGEGERRAAFDGPVRDAGDEAVGPAAQEPDGELALTDERRRTECGRAAEQRGWQTGHADSLREELADTGRQRDERRGERGDLRGAAARDEGEGLQRQRGGDTADDCHAELADTPVGGFGELRQPPGRDGFADGSGGAVEEPEYSGSPRAGAAGGCEAAADDAGGSGDGAVGDTQYAERRQDDEGRRRGGEGADGDGEAAGAPWQPDRNLGDTADTNGRRGDGRAETGAGPKAGGAGSAGAGGPVGDTAHDHRRGGERGAEAGTGQDFVRRRGPAISGGPVADRERARRERGEGEELRADRPPLQGARSRGSGGGMGDTDNAGLEGRDIGGCERADERAPGAAGDTGLADARNGLVPEPRRGPERRDGSGSAGESLRGSGGLGFVFAPGPSHPGWPALLVRHPWLRPAISQAEAESLLRGAPHGLADLLGNRRTDALRIVGNGVVALSGAFAFVSLARKISRRKEFHE